jgi:large subunit ribosomal protein L4
MSVATFTKSGTKATTSAKLDANVFAVEVKNHELLKQAYSTYLANGRENLSKTLRRGEVRGGGKKPWKQKGTGRARFGSIRVPIWRGGGITFGPLGEENYSKDLSIKAKRTAIRQALSLKNAAGALIIVEDFAPKEFKTSEAAKFLQKIGAKGTVLIAVSEKNPELNRSVRNLKGVELVQATYLNTYSILNADSVVLTEKALAAVTAWLGSDKEAK